MGSRLGALAHGLKTAKQHTEEDYERQRQQLLDQIMMETTRLNGKIWQIGYMSKM